MRRAVGESISDAWKPKQPDEVRGYPILQRTIAAVPPTETTRLPRGQSGGVSTCTPTVSIATMGCIVALQPEPLGVFTGAADRAFTQAGLAGRSARPQSIRGAELSEL